ncbi:MAG: segregation/condensation protein A [Candidatus Promineofilum sp.]|nr:segregation/condensation protein A [Promineifilum sp.]MCW5862674.1 segregation/condensation protein A [Anaerolineae bacterium]
MKGYRVELPVFNGPLDLLLHLIEREELDITAVSLVQVTGQYLEQVRQLGDEQLEGLIDFISIGARLLLIKSRALLPRPPALPGDEVEEEDPTEALLRQLRAYKRFKTAAQWLDGRQRRGLRTYLRVAPPPQLEGHLDLTGVDVNTLLGALHAVLARTEVRESALSVAQPRTLTIEDQLRRLRARLGRGRAFLFSDVLVNPHDRTEIAVTLLALLELIKRREAQASQSYLFGPIEVAAAAAEPEAAAPAE